MKTISFIFALLITLKVDANHNHQITDGHYYNQRTNTSLVIRKHRRHKIKVQRVKRNGRTTKWMTYRKNALGEYIDDRGNIIVGRHNRIRWIKTDGRILNFRRANDRFFDDHICGVRCQRDPGYCPRSTFGRSRSFFLDLSGRWYNQRKGLSIRVERLNDVDIRVKRQGDRRRDRNYRWHYYTLNDRLGRSNNPIYLERSSGNYYEWNNGRLIFYDRKHDRILKFISDE